MKRSEIVEIIHDICVNCDDRNYGERWERGLKEAIKELEGTRSIEEVRERIGYHERTIHAYGYPSYHDTSKDEDMWFLKEEE